MLSELGENEIRRSLNLAKREFGKIVILRKRNLAIFLDNFRFRRILFSRNSTTTLKMTFEINISFHTWVDFALTRSNRN